ncbi:MAG: DNA -binding domain-containing protein [Cypionkella sp.]
MTSVIPAIAAVAPSDTVLTGYDQAHAITYLRLLDAEAEGADWREVARVVLGCDPDNDLDCAKETYESHLARARWMTTHGYEHLLRGGSPH